MSDRVRMYHPNIPGTHQTPVERSRRQYERVWRALGWRLWPPRKKKKAADDKEKAE